MGADASAPSKRLIVRAEEKTRNALDEFGSSFSRTDADAHEENAARMRVEQVLTTMRAARTSSGDADVETYQIPNHLKDLPVDEIPEESRASVLAEIEKFRLSAVARDAAERKREMELERRRALERAERERAALARGSPAHDAAANGVASSDPETADEDAERARRARAADDAARRAQHAVAAYEAKERIRIAHWDDVRARESADAARRAAEHDRVLREWDAAREDEELTHELFWTQRRRWLQQRAAQRTREEQADEQDRRDEVQEAADARAAAERFLAEQEREMAEFAERQRAAGVLLPKGGDAPIRLQMHRGEAGAAAPADAAPRAGLAEDDAEDGAERRLQLLEQLRRETAGSDSEREQERLAKLQLLDESVPEERPALFAVRPQWDQLDEVRACRGVAVLTMQSMVRGTYVPWLDSAVEESIGERVEELVEAVVEKIREHASAQELVETMEPVLAEDAEGVVEGLWRKLVKDTLRAAAGL